MSLNLILSLTQTLTLTFALALTLTLCLYDNWNLGQVDPRTTGRTPIFSVSMYGRLQCTGIIFRPWFFIVIHQRTRAVASLEEAEGHQHLAGGHGGGCEQNVSNSTAGSGYRDPRIVLYSLFLIQNRFTMGVLPCKLPLIVVVAA